MLNMLVVEDDVIQCKQIINYISSTNKKIRLCSMAFNGEEALELLRTENIDLLILDLNLPNISGYKLINIIEKENLLEKNSIIIITGEEILFCQLSNNPYIYSAFSKPFVPKALMNSINQIVSFKDEEIIRNKIINELQTIHYNFKYNGTQYLLDSIYQLYVTKNIDSENLSKNVYPVIAKKYNKSINNIHTNIKQATKFMYRDCNGDVLKKYFCFYDDIKPTEKEVIYTILNKIS